MRAFRVSYYVHMKSAGFAFASSERLARQYAREFKIAHADDPAATATIEQISIIPTRRGLISLLNRYGGHPDNG